METRTSEIIDRQLDLAKLGVAFTTKPLIIGGLAMEYYGLRQHGSDIDFMISFEDYNALAARYPDKRKDSWGDLGVVVHGFEMFRTIWKLDYAFFAEDAIEFDRYKVLSIEKLLFIKVLSMKAGEKHRNDIDLIMKYILKNNQRPDIVEYMNSHLKSYLNAPEGIIYNEKY
jgi:hypothetical protein